MTITERAAKVLQEIDADLVLAEKLYESTYENAPDMPRNIAGWLTALRCLKTAIDELLFVQRQQHNYTLAERASAALTTLCAEWDNQT